MRNVLLEMEAEEHAHSLDKEEVAIVIGNWRSDREG